MVVEVSGFTGPPAQFRRMLDLLAERARAQGLLVVPGAGAANFDELVRVAAARAQSSAAGGARLYTALLSLATIDGSPLAATAWERAGQLWEALGGTWGGRVSPEARGLFIWRIGA